MPTDVDDTELQILEAAGEIIATDDFDSLSMRRVAAQAGVSLSTVVRHFGTKDALLAALVTRGGDDDERDELRHADLPRRRRRRGASRHSADYEGSGQQLMHMLAQEHRFPALSGLLDIGRRGHRRWVRWAFEPQLARHRGAGKAQVEDLLVVATDVYTWKLLRIDRGLSARATRAR